MMNNAGIVRLISGSPTQAVKPSENSAKPALLKAETL